MWHYIYTYGRYIMCGIFGTITNNNVEKTLIEGLKYIEYRGYDQKIVETLANNAGVPVWNGLTDEFHPTQMLADIMTVKELKDYVWKSELRLDIVVKKDGEYCPVELKYKTKKIERQISRFDERLKKSVTVMKDQGAQDLGMYDFWKDVRRVELVRNRFDKVKGGLAVFVTNDAFYTKGSKETSNNYLFSMTEDKPHTTQKHWLNPESTCAKTHPNFEVEKEYQVKWNQHIIDGVDFYYCIVTI